LLVRDMEVAREREAPSPWLWLLCIMVERGKERGYKEAVIIFDRG
jgi:hypothetical protein